jgi:uncharacterized protein (UPF0332 family)
MDEYESEISANLERADTNLQVASELLDKGYYDVSASRAYYAAFYAASALLLNEGIDTSKHSGVIALVHQHFVKNIVGSLPWSTSILSKPENSAKNRVETSTGFLSFGVWETMEFRCMSIRMMHGRQWKLLKNSSRQ